MIRPDHISISVTDWRRSRDFYRDHFGFEVEFEIPERNTAALKDDADLTLFVSESGAPVASGPGLGFTLQVNDVEAKHAELRAKGVAFTHGPMKAFWGYGAELRDPDGYRLMLWDETSMKAKGGA
jgi:catechol 2,3-dioxygenase-like lactoylglutathione lyase family enzyme